MEFKRLSDVEVVAEPTESANVLIEENGVIKKAPKSAIGVQEYDLDIEITSSYYSNEDGGDFDIEYTINSINTFENIKNKIFGKSVPKSAAKLSFQQWGNAESPYAIEFVDGSAAYCPENYMEDGSPEFIQFNFCGSAIGCYAVLTSDNVFQGVFLD